MVKTYRIYKDGLVWELLLRYMFLLSEKLKMKEPIEEVSIGSFCINII